MYHGDIKLGDTIDIKFTTRQFTTGEPFTLGDSPAVAAYVGNSTTEVTAGITLSVDFDGRTGLNNVRVVATAANGYATATNVALVITAGTVDGVSVVGETIGSFSIGNRVNAQTDAVWNAILIGATYNLTNSAGRRLRQLGGAEITIHSGTAQAGSTSTTIKLDTGAIATNDIYNGATIVLTGGTGVGQTRRIVDYVGSTRVASLDRPWTVTPTATSTFDVVASVRSLVSDEGTAQAGDATTITLATTASTINDVYNGSLVTIQAGTGSGQTREILDYVGATRVATISVGATDWAVAPDSTSIYAVIPNSTTATDELSVPSAAENAAAVTAVLSSPFIKNEAFPGFCFEMVNALDHVSEMPGLTVTAQRSIDGGAYAACTNAPTGVANGTYAIDLSADDLNGDFITLRFTATGADATKIGIKTQELVA